MLVDLSFCFYRGTGSHPRLRRRRNQAKKQKVGNFCRLRLYNTSERTSTRLRSTLLDRIARWEEGPLGPTESVHSFEPYFVSQWDPLFLVGGGGVGSHRTGKRSRTLFGSVGDRGVGEGSIPFGSYKGRVWRPFPHRLCTSNVRKKEVDKPSIFRFGNVSVVDINVVQNTGQTSKNLLLILSWLRTIILTFPVTGRLRSMSPLIMNSEDLSVEII